MFSINVENLDVWQRALATNLEPTQTAALVAIAEEGRDFISPYPPAPPRKKNRWYERGYGPRWQRRDGTIGGRKTSETLGRKWRIIKGRGRVVLENRASYAGWVHRKEKQARIHTETGWKTEVDMEQELNRRSAATTTAIQRAHKRALEP